MEPLDLTNRPLDLSCRRSEEQFNTSQNDILNERFIDDDAVVGKTCEHHALRCCPFHGFLDANCENHAVNCHDAVVERKYEINLLRCCHCRGERDHASCYNGVMLVPSTCYSVSRAYSSLKQCLHMEEPICQSLDYRESPPVNRTPDRVCSVYTQKEPIYQSLDYRESPPENRTPDRVCSVYTQFKIQNDRRTEEKNQTTLYEPHYNSQRSFALYHPEYNANHCTSTNVKKLENLRLFRCQTRSKTMVSDQKLFSIHKECEGDPRLRYTECYSNKEQRANMCLSKHSETKPVFPKKHLQKPKQQWRQKPNVKLFKCQKCDISCSNKAQLRGHLRTHTGERPFVCIESGCGKSFIRNEELTRHKRIHTGERPYVCSMCSRSFGRKDHLLKHVTTHSIVLGE